jgi:hypothetical protein
MSFTIKPDGKKPFSTIKNVFTFPTGSEWDFLEFAKFLWGCPPHFELKKG